jgi:hypothetical protein
MTRYDTPRELRAFLDGARIVATKRFPASAPLDAAEREAAVLDVIESPARP